jgi:hypothetical protein
MVEKFRVYLFSNRVFSFWAALEKSKPIRKLQLANRYSCLSAVKKDPKSAFLVLLSGPLSDKAKEATTADLSCFSSCNTRKEATTADLDGKKEREKERKPL